MPVCVISDVTIGHPEIAANYPDSKRSSGIGQNVEFKFINLFIYVCLVYIALYSSMHYNIIFIFKQ